MDIYLDTLLNLPWATVESFREIDDFVYFKIDLINEEIHCPHCHKIITEIHQIEYVLIRDLSVFGKKVYLQVPRRQFYCPDCHKHSTERLEFIEWRHRYTLRRVRASQSRLTKGTQHSNHIIIVHRCSLTFLSQTTSVSRFFVKGVKC